MDLRIDINANNFSIKVEESNKDENLFDFLEKLFNFIEKKKNFLSISMNHEIKTKYNEDITDKKINIKKNYDDVQNSILITKTSAIIDEIKKLASKYLKFTPEGDVMYIINLNKLTNIEQIFLVTLEKSLLFKEGLTDNDIVTSEYISEKINLDMQQIRSRLADLVREKNLKRVGRGEYKVNIYLAKEYLESILSGIEIK